METFSGRRRPDWQRKPGTEAAVASRQKLACSRLRDGGGKSFSNKKCEKRAGAGERQGGLLNMETFSRRHRPLSQVVRVLFSLCSF